MLKLEDVLWKDPGRMGGAVCFKGTRIPVAILFDYLDVGHLEQFYQGYPDVTPEMVHGVVQASKELVETFPPKKSA